MILLKKLFICCRNLTASSLQHRKCLVYEWLYSKIFYTIHSITISRKISSSNNIDHFPCFLIPFNCTSTFRKVHYLVPKFYHVNIINGIIYSCLILKNQTLLTNPMLFQMFNTQIYTPNTLIFFCQEEENKMCQILSICNSVCIHPVYVRKSIDSPNCCVSLFLVIDLNNRRYN